MTQHTKHLLADALKVLMIKKPLQKITIKELTDSCSVNRQTFYYHFDDIYQLLAWIYKSEAVSLAADMSYRTWQCETTAILEYLNENRAFCYATYRSLGKEYLERFLVSAYDTSVGRILDSMEEAKTLSPEDRTFIIRLYGYALSGVLQDWVASKFAVPPEKIAHQMCHSMEGTLLRMVKKFC